ncbi:MAG: nitroreductase family protein [Spirochaetaceae bacterium]|jgi:nitroreductase|nr:nitroreductase family protein [Spirochaetaceae bacterium]
MKATLKDLKGRRSIRAYKPEQITDEDLDAILEAGTWAPTGMGCQGVVIVAVQNTTIINKIQKLNAAVLEDPKAKPFYGAPTVITVFVDKTKPTPIENGNLVIGNLLNAAHALGVGSCYIYRAKEVFETEEGKSFLKKWKLSGDYTAVGHVLLGYAAETPKPAARKDGYIIKVR